MQGDFANLNSEVDKLEKLIYRPTELSEAGQAWYPLVKQQIGPIESSVYHTLPKNSLNRLKFNMAEILENSNKLTVGELNALKAAGSHMDDIVLKSKSEFPAQFVGSGGIKNRLKMNMENILADLETGALTPGRMAKLKNVMAREASKADIDAALVQKFNNDEGIQQLLKILMDKGL